MKHHTSMNSVFDKWICMVCAIMFSIGLNRNFCCIITAATFVSSKLFFTDLKFLEIKIIVQEFLVEACVAVLHRRLYSLIIFFSLFLVNFSEASI